MALPNPEIFGPATLSMSQAISGFNSFLPKLSEVRKAAPNDPDMAGDVRMGEVGASTLVLGVGIIASSLTGSPAPIVTGMFMCLVMICLYEIALRGDRPFNPRES